MTTNGGRYPEPDHAPTHGAEGGGGFDGGEDPLASGPHTPAPREEDARPGASTAGIVIGQVVGVALGVVVWVLLALPPWPGLVGLGVAGMVVGALAGGVAGAQLRARRAG